MGAFLADDEKLIKYDRHLAFYPACTHSLERGKKCISVPLSNNIPPSSTKGSRVLSKMDSELALDLFLQRNSLGQGGAEDTP